ncbi:MAG: flagellar motor protein MotD [Steroidobacteraceae bacterium]
MSRRRKNKHEEHQNHEAWAIPYADLITLLLAFFVVMYAISTVNSGKYRVLSNSLFAAFRGTPRSLEPIEVGERQPGDEASAKTSVIQQAVMEQSTLGGAPRSMIQPVRIETIVPKLKQHALQAGEHMESAQAAAETRLLERVADKVVRALDELVRAHLVIVKRSATLVEVEIRTDILFPSGSATLAPTAVPVIERLGQILKPFPNPVRVEGHTDDRPIDTVAFPSNWELSAARAASVVRRFIHAGVDPTRLSVIGHAQYEPAAPNTTAAGRNANRRVVIEILSTDGSVPQSVRAITDDPQAVQPITEKPSAEPVAQPPSARPATGQTGTDSAL